MNTENEQRTSELHKLRTLHLFSGAGGGILADMLLGHMPVCAVEIEPYCQQVLSARQKDGCLPWFPIFADVQAFDGKPWRGLVDVVAGGFPCQDLSCAGKGAGLDGERSGLWGEMRRIIGEIRPAYAFVENSPMLTIRGLDRVLGDFAEMGYDAEWGVISAADCGCVHLRERIWIVAHSVQNGKQRHSAGERIGKIRQGGKSRAEAMLCHDPRLPGESWPQPLLCGEHNGISGRLDRIAAIGNAQVPIVAATAWRILIERLNQP
jgi:DNA (cytosine-5)-methyltransferase 1